MNKSTTEQVQRNILCCVCLLIVFVCHFYYIISAVFFSFVFEWNLYLNISMDRNEENYNIQVEIILKKTKLILKATSLILVCRFCPQTYWSLHCITNLALCIDIQLTYIFNLENITILNYYFNLIKWND